MTDFWENMFSQGLPQRTTPFTIIQEQANTLAKHTQHLVYAQLVPITPVLRSGEGMRKYAFILEAPVLQFSFSLFEFSYPITGYPVSIRVDAGVAQALSWADKNVLAKDAGELLTLLGRIIRSSHTVQVVGSLMAEAGAVSGMRTPPTEFDDQPTTHTEP